MMLDKYFKRKFKTERSVKSAIKIKTFYDYCKINLRGDIILSQRYGYVKTIDPLNEEVYYTIINLVFTKNALDDLNDL